MHSLSLSLSEDNLIILEIHWKYISPPIAIFIFFKIIKVFIIQHGLQ